MLYKKWIDFVVFPSDSNKVKTREDRLKTENALSQNERLENPEFAKEFGYIVSWNDYDFNDDVFEAMWIDENGNVIIWTDKKVWSLHRRIDGKEKMIYLPRNPDLNLLF
jgi:hypothetical protein